MQLLYTFCALFVNFLLKCILNYGKVQTIPSVWVSQVVLVEKNLPANAGDIRDVGLIPGSGRSPGGGHGNPLQYSSLENPMDRGSQPAMVP